MKNISLPPKCKNLYRCGFLSVLALLITLNLLLTSCVQEPDAPRIELTESDQVSQVRAWFEENKSKLRLPEKGSNFRSESQELILPFFEKEPDWDKFHHYYFPDGREVFEISLENTQKFVSGTTSDPDQENLAKRMIQNILFVKNPNENRFDPLIVRYYPDEESSKRDFKEINYQMIDEKWSGVVDLFTYDEHFFIGFEIHKGQILSKRKIEVVGHSSRKLQVRPEQMDYRCSTITTDWYQITYVKETNTWVIQTLSPTRTYSCAIGGGGPSDLGYTGSSYTYGDPSSWGGGAPDYNPPPVPLPKLTIYIDISISSDPRLSCIVDKLSMSKFVSCVAEFTKTENQNTNTTLKLGKTRLIDGKYANGQTEQFPNGSFVITISEDNSPQMKSLEFAKTIFHEIMHAEIYRALQNNGITPIDGNFPANMDQFVKIYTQDNDNDRHHSYMAEVLLPNMAAELMEIHKTQFSDEFNKINEFVKKNYQNIYPKGLSSGFYENLLWGGMKGTRAFEGLKTSSSWGKYEIDISQIKTYLTQGC